MSNLWSLGSKLVLVGMIGSMLTASPLFSQDTGIVGQEPKPPANEGEVTPPTEGDEYSKCLETLGLPANSVFALDLCGNKNGFEGQDNLLTRTPPPVLDFKMFRPNEKQA